MKSEILLHFMSAKAIKPKTTPEVVLKTAVSATIFLADNYSGTTFKVTAFDEVMSRVLKLEIKEGDSLAGIAEMTIKNGVVMYKLLKIFNLGKLEKKERSDFSISFNNLGIEKRDINPAKDITFQDKDQKKTIKVCEFKLRYLGTNAKILFRAYDHEKKLLASRISTQKFIEGDVLDGFANLHFDKKEIDGKERSVKTYIIQKISFGSHNENAEMVKSVGQKTLEKQEQLSENNPFSGTEIPAGKAFGC